MLEKRKPICYTIIVNKFYIRKGSNMKNNTKKKMSEEKKRVIIVIALIASILAVTLIIMLATGAFSKDKNDDGTTNGSNPGSNAGSIITGSDNPLEGPIVDVEADGFVTQ